MLTKNRNIINNNYVYFCSYFPYESNKIDLLYVHYIWRYGNEYLCVTLKCVFCFNLYTSCFFFVIYHALD